MPRIVLERKEFTFGEVMFYDVKQIQLSIKNDGLTKCNVEILFHDPEVVEAEHSTTSDTTRSSARNYTMRRPNAKTRSSNQWVSIFPQYKEKIPPNTTYTIELATSFNYFNVGRINKHKSIEDFLVVKCINGNHVFASLSCTYKPTIIGYSLKGLSTLKPNESFELCDQENFVNVIETDIREHELHADLIFSTKRKEVTRENQINMASEFLGRELSGMSLSSMHSGSLSSDVRHNAALTANISLFQSTLYRTRDILIDQDVHFSSDLSEEYAFLMQHLIKRCEKSLEMLDKVDSKSSSSNIELTIEEQKNLILFYLSTRNYADFELANFDLDLLAQVLVDLLNSLPQPVIPFRYVDYCSFTDSSYEEAIKLFYYIPKSSYMLFELIVKFLQIYRECLTMGNEENMNIVNFHKIFADAIFQNVKKFNMKNEISTRFLSLFIFKHKNFQTI